MKNLTSNQDPDGVESVPAQAHHWLILMPPNMVNAVDGHSSHLREERRFLRWCEIVQEISYWLSDTGYYWRLTRRREQKNGARWH